MFPLTTLQAAQPRSSPHTVVVSAAVVWAAFLCETSATGAATGGPRGLRELHQLFSQWSAAGVRQRRPARGALGLGKRTHVDKTGVRPHFKYLPGETDCRARMDRAGGLGGHITCVWSTHA